MIKEAIGLGKTWEAARDEAIKSLKAPESADVKFEVLENATKKTFGIFGKERPAKVRAYYEEKEAPAKKKASDRRPEPKQQQEKKHDKPQQEKKPDKPQKAGRDTGKEKEKKEKNQESKPQKPAKTEAAPAVSAPGFEKAEEYLLSIIRGLGITDCKAVFKEEDDGISIDLSSDEDYGVVIGRRGETLDAIQYLVRLYLNKGKENYKRVSINIGNYREKRAATLEEIAKKSAARVLKYGRNVVLDPMNPYERRLIHTAIQGIDGVESHSVGYDSERKVVITLADGVKPTNSDSRGRGGRGGRGGHGGRGGKRPAAPAAGDEPKREPRSDLSNASRYGKIEPLKAAKPESED